MSLKKKIILVIAVIAIAILNPRLVKGGYKADHYEYPDLTARTLGMGGASVAFIDDGTAIFHNPAGLGRVNSLNISHSHSRYHFPGETENLDLLDADPTCFIIPLSGGLFGYPIGSAGNGWILQGELGYDYRTRNMDTVPEERLFGLGPGDRYQGAGFHLWPGGYWGFAHRSNEYLFTSGDELPDGVTWRRTGEGYSSGLQQAIIPGVKFGVVYDQLDCDYLPFRDGITGERTKTIRTGWAVEPTAWLRIASDTERMGMKTWPSSEETEVVRRYWGVEIDLGSWATLRLGNMDGHRTSGYSYNVMGISRDAAWVDGMMEGMVGEFPDEPEGIADYHATGFRIGNQVFQ